MNNSPFRRGDKVVAYCRYSEGAEQGQKNTSTEEQEAAIRKFCDENGIILERVFADPFASGRSVAKRDKYVEMLSFLLRKKKPDVTGVILWDYERYGRNFDRAQYDAAQLRMNGYKLFSMQQPIVDNSPFSHVVEAMYFASAQNQSDMISADVKRALQSNFTKYKVIPRPNIPVGWIAVPVKMGYYSDGRERIGYKAEPDPKYIEKIRAAVIARLNGAEMKEIRFILGGDLAKLTAKVNSLFRKTLLYGSLTYGGTTIEDYCKPIIDKDTFDRLQLYNASRPKRRRSPGAGVYSLNRSILSGLLVCGECGGHMHLDRRKAKGHTYETYFCNEYHVGVRREDIEEVMIAKAIELLDDEHWQKDTETLLYGVQDAEKDAEYKQSLQRQIREIDRKLKRIEDILIDSDIQPDTLLVRMKSLEKERADLVSILEAEDDKTERILLTAEQFRARILSALKNDQASDDDRRNALASFISEIIVTRETRESCKCIIRHGLPGFLSVASEIPQNDKRPSRYEDYTCNLIADMVIIHRLRHHRIPRR